MSATWDDLEAWMRAQGIGTGHITEVAFVVSSDRGLYLRVVRHAVDSSGLVLANYNGAVQSEVEFHRVSRLP